MSDDLLPKMLVLLGNPGSRYEKTRHNVARRLLDVDPFDSCAGWQRKFKADWAKCQVAGNSLVVLVPLTMMNLSGESVQAAARFFRYEPGEIVVAHDDTELAFGTIDIKTGGGLAGHNGLKSVAHCLSDRSFWRLRLGIGRPERGELHGHVLGRFGPNQEAEMDDFIGAASALLERGFSSGMGSLGKPHHFSEEKTR